ncbi:hypothetical protein BX666DRAFT_1921530 [Dichotomocladium elegans]|nr:hypothetical protein BX666DRAFT_1921530 [Dichotomocladium elegans]
MRRNITTLRNLMVQMKGPMPGSPNDEIYRTRVRQLTESPGRPVQSENNRRVELPIASNSSSVKDPQNVPEQKKKRIDISSVLAKRTATTQEATLSQSRNITAPLPSQFSSAQNQNHVLRRTLKDSNGPQQENKLAQSILENLPVRPKPAVKSQIPSRDIMDVRATHRQWDETTSPLAKRRRHSPFDDFDKSNVTSDIAEHQNTVGHRSPDKNDGKNAKKRLYHKSADADFSTIIDTNPPNSTNPPPYAFRESDNNNNDDQIGSGHGNMPSDDNNRSLGTVDDADLSIDEEFSKSIERITEDRIDRSFIRRLSNNDGVVPKARQDIQNNSSKTLPDTVHHMESVRRQKHIEMAEDTNDDLSRPTDFNAILKKVDSVRAQLAAATASSAPIQASDVSTTSKDEMEHDYRTDTLPAAKMDLRLISSVDERVERARRIIEESLKQSKLWFEKKPIPTTRSD